MIEKSGRSPKEQAAVEKNWAIVRERDKAKDHEVERDLETYEMQFEGLRELIKYVQNTETKTLLDAGAGEGVAINQLADSKLGHGLHLLASGLSKPQGYYAEKQLAVPYLVTPAETCEGIEDRSVGGILAHTSITYSASPDMIVESFDRILETKGVVKALLLRNEYIKVDNPDLTITTPEMLANSFKRKGYDVATNESPVKKASIVLAIKPGIKRGITAKELLFRDSQAKFGTGIKK